MNKRTKKKHLKQHILKIKQDEVVIFYTNLDKIDVNTACEFMKHFNNSFNCTVALVPSSMSLKSMSKEDAIEFLSETIENLNKER